MVQHGSQWANGGTYVCLNDGEWVQLPKRGGLLPGDGRRRYLKAPVAFVAGPLLGLAYFLFLPAVGFGMCLTLLARKGWNALRSPERVGPEAGRGPAHRG